MSTFRFKIMLSHVGLCNSMECSPLDASVHGDSPGKNSGMGCYTLLQGIFPTQGSNSGLPRCRQIFLTSEPPGKPRLKMKTTKLSSNVNVPFLFPPAMNKSSYYSIRLPHSVQFSCSVVFNSLQSHESQHARPPCTSPTPGVYSNSCSSSRRCHPTVSSSVIPFSSCPQSLPASGFFQ